MNYRETVDEVGERIQTMKMEDKIYKVTCCGNKVLIVREQLRYWGHSMPTRCGSNGGKEPWSLLEESWSALVLMFSQFVLVSFYFSLLYICMSLHYSISPMSTHFLFDVSGPATWCLMTKRKFYMLSICICTINSHRLIHLQTIIMLCASMSPLRWMFLLQLLCSGSCDCGVTKWNRHFSLSHSLSFSFSHFQTEMLMGHALVLSQLTHLTPNTQQAN